MAKVLPSVPLYSGSLFSWAKFLNGPNRTKHIGKGMVEVSTLGRLEPWTRVYEDACDVGFQVKSQRTLKVRTFVLTKEHRNDQGEVSYWEFASYENLDPIFITVFND